jgi:RHS repeat-associated protein
VQKSSGTLYWHGMSGDSLVETDLLGNNVTEYVFFGGKRIARRGPAGQLFYYVADHLGTSRMMVRAGQTSACYSADFYPFGGERVLTNTCPQNYKFTGKERDSESGLDNFIARYDSSTLGRFMSPDEPLIDQDESSPQSWNLYSYVRNNPLTNTDPSGNACVRNANGYFYDDESVGQTCKEVEASQPQKIEVKAPQELPPSAPSADDQRIIDFANEMNKRPILKFVGTVAGTGVVVGATGGAACYYLCSAATATTLGAVGTAGATAAPILYKTGDIIEEVVQTPQGPVKIVGEAVVEGTQLTIKNITVFSAETGEPLSVGVGNMLKALRPLFDGLREAGYTTVRIMGTRVSGANPGRAVDITKTLR